MHDPSDPTPPFVPDTPPPVQPGGSGENRKGQILAIVFSGCALVVFGLCGTCLWAGGIFSGREGGVRFSNNVEDYAVEELDARHILDEGEEVVAYFDVTLDLDGSEAAVLTDRKLAYYRLDRVRSIPLEEIVEVRVDDDGLGGQSITVFGENEIVNFTIPVFNGGPGFVSALERTRGRPSDNEMEPDLPPEPKPVLEGRPDAEPRPDTEPSSDSKD